ncbi:hypothetical protein RRF57_005336 [Xylaria bambusicola]|uniref:RRM domain-containing protein n=1 Tax=Xylaria bambusicola TaxID=326684 RepID=A0AAN7UQB0_9PEZI
MPSEIVYQHQNQTPINGTISGMAPPGNETGFYYIPIANLPWQTSWQELKDHVRSVCSVEHVEINEDSTSGHVVLKGRANFDAAFRMVHANSALELLNGGIFQDRALIADGRNVDSWVLIKRHVDGPNASTAALRHAAAAAQHTSLPVSPSSPGYVEWPAVSASPSYMMGPVMEPPSYFMPCAMPEYPDSASIYGMSSCALEHSCAAAVPYPSVPYAQQFTPSEYHGNGYTVPQNSKAYREGKKHVEAAPNKKRKIIIRQLQPWISESQVRELIHQKTGFDSDRLTKLDMPLADSQQGANRGYVFATFVSEDAAEKAIKRLNNYKYEGRVLEVKHTKDSMSDHHQSSHASRSGHHRHSHHSHHPRRDRHDDNDKTNKEKEHPHKVASSSEKKTTSEKKTKLSSSESDVVIVNGSSASYF